MQSMSDFSNTDIGIIRHCEKTKIVSPVIAPPESIRNELRVRVARGEKTSLCLLPNLYYRRGELKKMKEFPIIQRGSRP